MTNHHEISINRILELAYPRIWRQHSLPNYLVQQRVNNSAALIVPYNEHARDVLLLNSSVHHCGNSFHSQLEHCQTWKWVHQSACRNLYTCTKKQHSCTFIAPSKNFIIVSIFGNQCSSMLLHLERVNILPWSTMRFSNRIMSAVCEVFLTCQLEKNYNHYVLQYCRQKWWCHSCYQWQTSISETIEKSTWASQTNCDKNPQS